VRLDLALCAPLSSLQLENLLLFALYAAFRRSMSGSLLSHRLLQKLRFLIWYSDPTVIACDLLCSHASKCRKSPFRHQLDTLTLGSRLNRSPSIWVASLMWELYFNARTVQYKGGWVSPASHSVIVSPLGSGFKAV